MYEIGQKIVCVKTQSEGLIKKGETYTIKDIMISPCRCKRIWLTININGFSNYVECGDCGKAYKNNGSWKFDAKLFRPIDDLYNKEIKELTEVLNEPVTF